MSSSVQITELAFTVPAVLGLFINWWAMNDAIADLHYLQAKGLNGAREIVARAGVRNEAMRTAIQAMFVMLGVLLMFTEPANPEADVTRAGIAVSTTFITAELILVAKSILDRRDRHRVIAILTRKADA